MNPFDTIYQPSPGIALVFEKAYEQHKEMAARFALAMISADWWCGATDRVEKIADSAVKLADAIQKRLTRTEAKL